MFSRFFINRPIFASVLAIVIVLAGGVTVMTLPVAQYPDITPPTVQVSAAYPGANAQVVADTVAAPIEQQVNGVEGMLYMSSTSASDGSYKLTVTFEVGTDLDMASVLVQNRVALAEPKLPEEVKRQGVTTKKQSTSIILMIALSSPEHRYDSLYLANFATLRLRDQLSRVDGVGDVMIFGSSDYSMRVWLDPEKLKARHLTTQDVVNAIREQNVQVAAGQIGQPPAPPGQSFQYTITALGRLEDAEQFENIIIKTAEGGRITRVKDVARVELGSQSYNMSARQNSDPSCALAIYQLPGANAIAVAEQVRALMDDLSGSFPDGLIHDIPFDTTLFVAESIDEVFKTLIEAAILVFIVIFVFIQDWRATLIPAVTIPVSLIGTFAVMAGLGFSVNMLTLFGLVLAIGIVVDDAIIVVENATRHMEEGGLPPKEATAKAMDEVSGPIVATTLVLMAVFIPTAFMGGISGQMYRQFALTIAASTVFSAINSLTLSPALCAIILRKAPVKKNIFFRAFNRTFAVGERVYGSIVSLFVRRAAISMALFLVLVGAAGWGFIKLPTGFLPIEDQGYLMVGVQLPDAASLERTNEVLDKLDEILANTPGVADWTTIGGYSILSGTVSSNMASVFIVTSPSEERAELGLDQDAILADVRRKFYGIQEAVVFAFPPPAIMGLGVSGGFQMQLEDRGGAGLASLQQMIQEIVEDGNARPNLTALNSTFSAGVPQLFVDVDRTKAKTLNIPLSLVFDTLQAYLGSAYVNDFNKFGRTYQVTVQADNRFRIKSGDITQLDVRTGAGRMVPLGTLVTVEETLGPQVVTRYNLYPSASINGEAAAGFSSGDALAAMEQMAAEKLPSSMGFEWTGMSFQEKQVGSAALVIFALAIVLVYLVLAAQYESWTNPIAVILAVPLAMLGAVAAVAIRAMDINIYTQIGLVLLIALAAKNAILIVEFAREIHEEGKGVLESALEAAKLRFRPILMTSFAFILGVVPLVIASGAGAAARQALGTAVFGGMIAATFLAILFVPVFYRVFQGLSERVSGKPSHASHPKI